MTLLEARQGIAVLRSVEGEHQAALRDLERLMPLAHIIGKRRHPAHLRFLNSYASELSESNRTEEAEQVANVIAASPLISRYPEWQETVLEIRERTKRPTMIAVSHEQPAYNDPRVEAAVDFMNANFHRKITADDLAGVANISPVHFSRLFKLETGLTPSDYLIRLRIGKARQLLRTTRLSVKEVMASVGYNSKGHFSRHFKRQFGVRPSEYRSRVLRRS